MKGEYRVGGQQTDGRRPAGDHQRRRRDWGAGGSLSGKTWSDDRAL